MTGTFTTPASRWRSNRDRDLQGRVPLKGDCPLVETSARDGGRLACDHLRWLMTFDRSALDGDRQTTDRISAYWQRYEGGEC
jgi:hypothetical protein